MSPGGESGPWSRHIASNELLTGARPGQAAANLVQSCEIPSVCVGGQGLRAQGVKMVLLWVKHYSPVFEVVRVIQAAYQSHYTPG